MHKPESVLDNETRKIRCDYETQIDHLLLDRKPDLVIITKKKKKKKKKESAE